MGDRLIACPRYRSWPSGAAARVEGVTVRPVRVVSPPNPRPPKPPSLSPLRRVGARPPWFVPICSRARLGSSPASSSSSAWYAAPGRPGGPPARLAGDPVAPPACRVLDGPGPACSGPPGPPPGRSLAAPEAAAFADAGGGATSGAFVAGDANLGGSASSSASHPSSLPLPPPLPLPLPGSPEAPARACGHELHGVVPRVRLAGLRPSGPAGVTLTSRAPPGAAGALCAQLHRLNRELARTPPPSPAARHDPVHPLPARGQA